MTASEIKSFTSRRPPVSFLIDDEKFTAAGSVPAELMRDLMAQAETLEAATTFEARYTAIKVIVEAVLLPDSLEYFRSRLGDLANPIDFDALAEVSTWLVSEVYSRRPTPSPSPSGASASSDTTSSTDGPPPEASTPPISTGTATST